jgi:hypothetical protein
MSEDCLFAHHKTKAAWRRKLDKKEAKLFAGSLLAKAEARSDKRDADEISTNWLMQLASLRYLEANGLLAGSRALSLVERVFGPVDEEALKMKSGLSKAISDQDMRSGPEALGKLHQWRISGKKKEIFKSLKGHARISKEDLPAATQLFTPKWIARFLVENSLGRLWLESNPDEELRSGMKLMLGTGEPKLRVSAPEEIKIMDPCTGSGHILACAFDLLAEIYERAGARREDIPELAIKNNLAGLDIDEKAARLARFCLIAKALELNPELDYLEPSIAYFSEPKASATMSAQMKNLCSLFSCAKEQGSLIRVCDFDLKALGLEAKSLGPEAQSLVAIASSLSEKKHVVCTNPPYMGKAAMSSRLSDYVKICYPSASCDLFAAFMERCLDMAEDGGYVAMITQHSWMFLQSYEKLREKMLKLEMTGLAHLGAQAFEDITGEVVQTAAFSIRKTEADALGVYLKLDRLPTSCAKESALIEAASHISKDLPHPLTYRVRSSEFSHMPAGQMAYWSGDALRRCFGKGVLLKTLAEPRQGLATGDNDRFLRLWHEVDISKCGFGLGSRKEAEDSGLKWFPYNKGGERRRWYGNNEYVVNWEKDGKEIKEFADADGKQRSRPQNKDWYFKPSITWSFVTTTAFTARLSPKGSLFDIGGSSVFPPDDMAMCLLALLNSKIAFSLMKMQNPTLNFQVGNVGTIPVIVPENKDRIQELAQECVSISKAEWDSFEESWDFKRHPLLSGPSLLEEAFAIWDKLCKSRSDKLMENEAEINRLFIEAYDLKDSVLDESEKPIYLRQADLKRDAESLISFAIGWAFGRFSLDGSELPCPSSLILLSEACDYLKAFLAKACGKESLSENLDFLAEAIYPNSTGSAEERLRRYFGRDFWASHIKFYKKRPIYYLLDSGSHGAFKALAYSHGDMEKAFARAKQEVKAEIKAETKRKPNSRKIGEAQSFLEALSFDPKKLDLDLGAKANCAMLQAAHLMQKMPEYRPRT